MLDRLRVHHFRLIIPILAGLTFTVGVILMYSNYREVEWAEASRIGTNNQALAQAGAQSIKEFFDAREIEILLLIKYPVIQQEDSQGSRNKIESLYNEIAEKGVDGIVRINKNGEFIYGISEKVWYEEKEGNVSERDYFIWARNPINREKTYVTQPVLVKGGPEEGKMLVSMITPVYWQEKFNGIVMFSFLPNKLAEVYLLPLHPYAGSNTFIIDQNGSLITCTREPAMVGENIVEYFKNLKDTKYESLKFLFEEMQKGKEGWVVADFALPGKNYGKEIVGFAPIQFSGQQWSIGSTVSYPEVFSRIQKYASRQGFMIIFVLLAALTISTGLVVGIRVAERDAFVNGFRDGRDGMKKAKKTKKK